MSQYYVVDVTSGQKYGPADVATLNQWIQEGRLAPDSMLEDAVTGSQGRAGDLPALLFPNRDVPSSIPNPSPGPSAPTPEGNPYAQAPTVNSPYPRPGMGMGNAMAGYPPGVYFEFIGKSWDYIKPNIGQWMAASLIYIVVLSAITQPLSFVAAIFGGTTPSGEMANPVMFFGITALSYIISFGFNGLMLAGFVGYALDQIDGKTPEFGRLFSPFKNFVNNFVGSLLSYLAIIVGVLLCIVPGIYVAGRLIFTNVLITEQGVSASEGLKMSWERMAPFAWMMALVYIVTSLIAGLGVIACCIGILVTLPFIALTMAQHYRVLFPEDKGPVGGF